MPTDGEGMEGRNTDGALITSVPPKIGRIAAARLRVLIEAWRTRAAMAHASNTAMSKAVEIAYINAANELEAALNDV